MKVLVVGPSPSRSKGGMATVIQNIEKDVDLNKEFEIDIHESFIDGSVIRRALHSVVGYMRFLRIYKKYDLFHIHMVSNGSTFRKAYYVRTLKKHNKKIILHMHVGKYLEFFEALNDKKKKYVRSIFDSAHMVILLSEGWRSIFRDCVGVSEEKIEILNNGIDTCTYQEAITDVTKTPKEFLFLGRVGERKGAYDVVAAVEKIKNEGKEIHCVMAGDGDVEIVRQLVKEKGLENMIELTGWIGPEKRMELLKQVSTMLLPSYHEGLPMTLLEGMAAGKAVITTAVGSIPEFVEDGVNGAVLQPGDVDGIKEKLIWFSEHPEMLQEMSVNNRAKIEKGYTCKVMHEKLAGFYRKLM